MSQYCRLTMKYDVYKTRWILLAIECSSLSARRFVCKGLEVSNNAITEYFDVNPYAVDVLATVDTMSALPIGLALAVLGGRLGLRSLMLMKSFLTFLSTLLCTIGFISTNLYWIVFVGRVISPEALLYVIPTVLAANWFPENELAITFNIPSVLGTLVTAVAGLAYPFLLNGKFVPLSAVGTNLSLVEDINTSINRTHLIFNEQDTRIKLVSVFGATSFLLLIVLVLTIIFCKDHPPTPPSASQANILRISEADGSTVHQPTVDIWFFIQETKKLIQIPQFLLIVIASFLRGSVRFSSVLMPSFMLQTFPTLDNRTPGLLVFVASFASVFGYIAAARLIDRYKDSKLITVTGYFVVILMVLAVYFGHLYKSLITLFIAYSMEWIFENMVFAGSSEFLLETTYPRNKMIVTTYYYSAYYLGIFIYVAFDRWLQQQTDETWAVFAFIPTNTVALVLYLIAKPEYKRTRIDKMEENGSSDEENGEYKQLIQAK